MSSDRNRVRYFIEKASPNYKAPLTQVYNVGRIYTPQDTRSSRRTAIRRTRSSAWTFGRKLWCSATLKSKRDAIFQCSSSTCILLMTATSGAAQPATVLAALWLPGPIGTEKSPQGLPGCSHLAARRAHGGERDIRSSVAEGAFGQAASARRGSRSRSVEVSGGAAIRVREKACPNLLAHKGRRNY